MSAGDTALATLVHNPRSMTALENAAKQKENTPLSATPGGGDMALATLVHNPRCMNAGKHKDDMPLSATPGLVPIPS